MAKLKFEDVEWKMKELHPDIELMQDFFVDKKTRMKCPLHTNQSTLRFWKIT